MEDELMARRLNSDSPDGVWCIVCHKVHAHGECEFEGLCNWCKKRPATIPFGDALFHTHFRHNNCCEICALQQQIDHARERAAVLPELEAQLEVLLKNESSE